MPIENRNLEPGTRLVGRYKGQTYHAEVVQTEEGIRYRLEDGREFKSPSSAGAAIFGEGRTCNGWAFWSLADEACVEKPKKERKRGKRSKKVPEFERLEDGRYFCNACMEAFEVVDDQEPSQCPQGHNPDGQMAEIPAQSGDKA